MLVNKIYKHVEAEREHHPNRRPGQRLDNRYHMAFSIEQSEIDGEHRRHENNEAQPKEDFHKPSAA